jgi:ABC-type polysaccharide/polyol phosphate export permease
VNALFYKQKALDYLHNQKEQGALWIFWFFLLPVVPLLAYVFLGFLKVLPSAENIPRVAYIIIGITLWLLLSDGITQPLKSAQSNKAYFVRQEISLFGLFTAWLPERMITAGMQFVFCLVFAFIVKSFGLLGLATYVGITILGFAVFLTLGVLFAVIGLISPSTTNLIETGNRFLLFLSGVIFPLPDGSVTDVIKVANPYYVVIDNARLALFGLPVDWVPLSCWLILSVLLLLLLRPRLQAIAPDVREFLQ